MNAILFRNTNSSSDHSNGNIVLGMLNRVLNNFQYTQPTPTFECLPEHRLSDMCMAISEKSLHEVWDNEADEEWSKY